MPQESLEELATSEYWDKRYKQASKDSQETEVYEWFRRFADLRKFFSKHLPPVGQNSKVLHLGCGDSVRCLSFAVAINESLY